MKVRESYRTKLPFVTNVTILFSIICKLFMGSERSLASRRDDPVLPHTLKSSHPHRADLFHHTQAVSTITDSQPPVVGQWRSTCVAGRGVPVTKRLLEAAPAPTSRRSLKTRS